jgi:hypothetical protein
MVNGTPELAEYKIIPDGSASIISANGSASIISTNRKTLNAYLEMDLGTIPKRLCEKLRAYMLHYQEMSKQSKGFAVLFVTPDRKRSQVIRSWALAVAKEIGADPTIFWTTEQARISESTVLTGPIWTIADGPAAVALLKPPLVAPHSREDGYVAPEQQEQFL